MAECGAPDTPASQPGFADQYCDPPGCRNGSSRRPNDASLKRTWEEVATAATPVLVPGFSTAPTVACETSGGVGYGAQIVSKGIQALRASWRKASTRRRAHGKASLNASIRLVFCILASLLIRTKGWLQAACDRRPWGAERAPREYTAFDEADLTSGFLRLAFGSDMQRRGGSDDRIHKFDHRIASAFPAAGTSTVRKCTSAFWMISLFAASNRRCRGRHLDCTGRYCTSRRRPKICSALAAL